jgi:hypothetical protein
MLDEQRLMTIELLIDGKHDKKKIAEMVGRSRRWLYDVLDEEEVKAELHRREQALKLHGEKRLIATLDKAIDNIVALANTASSEKVKLDANIYLIDRKLGRPTSKHEVEATAIQNTNKVSIEEFEAELEEIDIELDEE